MSQHSPQEIEQFLQTLKGVIKETRRLPPERGMWPHEVRFIQLDLGLVETIYDLLEKTLKPRAEE